MQENIKALIFKIRQTGKSSKDHRQKIQHYFLNHPELVEIKRDLTLKEDLLFLGRVPVGIVFGSPTICRSFSNFEKLLSENNFASTVLSKFLLTSPITYTPGPSKSLQKDNGQAWEYALLKALEKLVSAKRPVEIIDSPKVAQAKLSFATLNATEQNNFNSSALVAIAELILQESNLVNYEPQLSLEVFMLPDEAGKKGDVRDIGFKVADYESGISGKHKNQSVKSPRAYAEGFASKWGLGAENTKSFLDKIKLLFNKKLTPHVEEKKTWEEVYTKEQKHEEIYKPFLEIFKQEIETLSVSPQVVNNFVSFLVGAAASHYKILKTARGLKLEGYNFNNPLMQCPAVKLPTKLLKSEFLEGSKNKIILTFNENWTLSLRVHSASSQIQNNLKIEVEIIKSPFNVWNKEV